MDFKQLYLQKTVQRLSDQSFRTLQHITPNCAIAISTSGLCFSIDLETMTISPFAAAETVIGSIYPEEAIKGDKTGIVHTLLVSETKGQITLQLSLVYDLKYFGASDEPCIIYSPVPLAKLEQQPQQLLLSSNRLGDQFEIYAYAFFKDHCMGIATTTLSSPDSDTFKVSSEEETRLIKQPYPEALQNKHIIEAMQVGEHYLLLRTENGQLWYTSRITSDTFFSLGFFFF